MHLNNLLSLFDPTSANRLPFTTLSLALLSLLPPTVAQTASDYYVHSLPGAPDGPLLKMHAGHVEVNPETHGSLFFWHYQNRNINHRERTVIWLNGGPGCSSMDGNLMEIGPYRVEKGGNLRYNNGSWDEFANLLFVDNPVGTGFSFVDSNSYIHELQDMADNFMVFLESWFKIFPEYEDNDIYIAGESYAGQHIPYIANTILNRSKDSKKGKWNLRGLLIGNGWISDDYQSPQNLQFAYDNDLIKKGSRSGRNIEKQQQKCLDKLTRNKGEHVDSTECEMVLQEIIKESQDMSAPVNERCVNMYDMKLRDNYPSCGMNWPPDLKDVTPYLRQQDVLQALHIDKSKKSVGWTECNNQVSSAFKTPNSKPSFDLLPSILEQVPIILFSGADDLICNHAGTENVIANLNWNGGKGFSKDSKPRGWTFDGENAGTYHSDRNLTYILFDKSSHMVPFDYPKRSRDMLDRFMGIEQSLRYPTSRIEGETLQDIIDDHDPFSSEADMEMSEGEDDLTDEEAAIAQQATWDAYYRSGEVALVVVIIAAGVWGWWVWRDRRRRAGYNSLQGGSIAGPMMDGVRDVGSGATRMEAFRPHRDEEDGPTDDEDGGKGYANRAKPYADSGGRANGVSAEQARRYSLGSASESDEDEGKPGGRR